MSSNQAIIRTEKLGGQQWKDLREILKKQLSSHKWKVTDENSSTIRFDTPPTWKTFGDQVELTLTDGAIRLVSSTAQLVSWGKNKENIALVSTIVSMFIDSHYPATKLKNDVEDDNSKRLESNPTPIDNPQLHESNLKENKEKLLTGLGFIALGIGLIALIFALSDHLKALPLFALLFFGIVLVAAGIGSIASQSKLCGNCNSKELSIISNITNQYVTTRERLVSEGEPGNQRQIKKAVTVTIWEYQDDCSCNSCGHQWTEYRKIESD